MIFRVWAAVLATALLILAAPAASGQAIDAAAAIPTDPAVRQGRLPNGFRYAVMSNDRPVGGISLRLSLDVGSYEEPEGVGGVAHFLEHMAFNGTRALAEGELARRFAQAGVSFGRDQNASTSRFATVYRLDLPKADEVALDLGFRWLRDIGDGLLLTPEAVERERGVIQAEHNTRLGPGKDWTDAYQTFAAPGARSRLRPPVGTPESIRAIDAAALSDFHRTWYRPDNAAVTVAGDLPVEVLEARVIAAFGDWTAASTPVERAQATPLDTGRSLDVLIYPEARLAPSLSVCRPSAWTTLGPDTFARRQALVTRGLWLGLLNRRFQRLAQGEAAPFSSAVISFSPWTREADAVCLNIAPPVGGDWRRALSTALTEIRRFETHGPDTDSFGRMVESQKEVNATTARQVDDRLSENLAQGLLGLFPPYGLDPVGFTDPRSVPALYEAVVAPLGPTEIRDDFVRAWTGGEPLIAVRMPEPPTAEEIRAVWGTMMGDTTPDALPTARRAGRWAYGRPGRPGAIVSRETVAEPGFTRVRFRNGVVLNVKSAAYTRDLVQVGVELGDGRAGIADADFQAASLGAGFVTLGGTRRHSRLAIHNIFPTRRIGLTFAMTPDSFQLSGPTRPSDLETQLQLVVAMLGEPGFRDDFQGQRRQMVDSLYRAWRTQPQTVLNLAMVDAVAPNSPRRLPPREQIEALTMADFERVFRPVLTRSPLEVTIVGDMPEEEMIDLAARTVGSLPPRTATSRSASGFVMRFGDDRPRIEAVHEGAADQAGFTAVWPLFVSEPSRRREQRAMALVRTILHDRLNEEVREALGATYGPRVTLTFEDAGDQGSLSVHVATSPADIERVRDAVRRVAADLAAGNVTQADLDNARTPALARIPADRATTNWWYGVMKGSARNPQVVTDALSWEGDYRAVTLEEIRTAMRQWLSGPAIEGTVLPEAANRSSASAGAIRAAKLAPAA